MKVLLQNVTKIFPSRSKKQPNPVVAVNDFSFDIADGTLIGLLGPSGCGKSTVLNLISGLLKPTSGKIFCGGEDVAELAPERRGVGLGCENGALCAQLAVKKNITFPLENLKGKNKLSKEQMDEMALEAAKLVQIDMLMDRKPSELSGGQQQRVAIARALVKNPKVLLLDEPLSNLDARLRLQTREEIRRIQRSTGVTTIFVTHDQEEAMSISDLIVVMKDGVIHQIDKPQNVYDDPIDLFVAKFLGTPPINVFDGRVESGKLFVGEEVILDVPSVPNGNVDIAIRPEGFDLDENPVLTCDLSRVEVMGRDISVVATHTNSQNPVVRAIIDSNNLSSVNGTTVKFGLKPNKVFIFEKETGKRIRF